MMIILLNLVENDKISISKCFRQSYFGKRMFYVTIFATPFPIFLFYKIEDDKAWSSVYEFINYDLHLVYNIITYHIGVMMSHYTLLVTITVLGVRG
jgi:hypothetical protein